MFQVNLMEELMVMKLEWTSVTTSLVVFFRPFTGQFSFSAAQAECENHDSQLASMETELDVRILAKLLNARKYRIIALH